MDFGKTRAAAAWLLAMLLCTPLALAHEGHDEAPPAAGPAAPRFSAVSELFELVGIVQGGEIVMYLDRYADNSPVKDAQVELELNGTKVAVKPEGEGEYHAELPKDMQGGTISVAASVSAGKDMDLLAADLQLHEEHAVPAAAGFDRKKALMWTAAALAVLVVLILGARRLRGNRLGGAA